MSAVARHRGGPLAGCRARACRLAVLVALALQTSACGSLVEPFEGMPEQSAGSDIIAVCYNKYFTSPQEVRDVAARACGADTVPQLVDQDMELSCPLLTPVRANFRCAAE